MYMDNEFTPFPPSPFPLSPLPPPPFPPPPSPLPLSPPRHIPTRRRRVSLLTAWLCCCSWLRKYGPSHSCLALSAWHARGGSSSPCEYWSLSHTHSHSVLYVCMYVHVHVCMYICMQCLIHVHSLTIHMFMFPCLHVSMFPCFHVSMFPCVGCRESRRHLARLTPRL